MKSLLAILLFVLTLNSASFCQDKVRVATGSANQWLRQVDAGDYAASY